MNPKRINRLEFFSWNKWLLHNGHGTSPSCSWCDAMQTASGYKEDKWGVWISAKLYFINSLDYFSTGHPTFTEHLKGFMYSVLCDAFVWVLMPASIGSSCQSQMLRFVCTGSFNVLHYHLVNVILTGAFFPSSLSTKKLWGHFQQMLQGVKGSMQSGVSALVEFLKPYRDRRGLSQLSGK